MAAGALHPDAQAIAQGANSTSVQRRHCLTGRGARTPTFTKATGITIRRVDADDAALLAACRASGAQAQPTSLLLVDAARALACRGRRPSSSRQVQAAFEARIPAHLRGRTRGQGSQWFGFSTRAPRRRLQQGERGAAGRRHHAELAGPKNRAKVCARSGSHRTTCRSSAPASSRWARGATEHVGCAASSPTWRAPPRAATPTRSEPSPAASARSRLSQLLLPRAPECAPTSRGQGGGRRSRVMFPGPAQPGFCYVNIAGGAVAKRDTRPPRCLPRVPQRASRPTASPTATTNGRGQRA